MKRVLSFMTIAAMLIAMTALPAAAEKVQNAAGDWELMNEKFDNDTVVSEGTFNIAKKTGESYTVVDAAEESLPDAAAHGKVVKIAKNASGNVDNYFRIAYSGTQGVIADQCDNPKEELKQVRTSFDMYLPNLLGGANLRFFNTLNGSTQASNLIGLTATGNMNFINGESIPYSAKTWYHFDIYFDFTGGNKCTIYRNNELVADNIDTYAGVTNKMLRDALVSFGLQMGGTADAYSLYMDNMQFAIPGDFQMLSAVPENGAENVAVMKPVTLNFNHPAPNADTAGITVSADGTPVEGVTVSEKNGVITVTPPAGGFAYETTYTVSAETGLTDIWGNSLAEAASVSFTTEQEGADKKLVDENFDTVSAVPGQFDYKRDNAGLSTAVVHAADENLPDAAAHDKVVKIAKDASGSVDHYFRIRYDTAQESPNNVVLNQVGSIDALKCVRASFDICLKQAMGVNIRFMDRKTGSGMKADNLIVFSGKGTVSFLNSGTTMDYEAGEWYHFDVYLNFDGTKEYTVYCNGELKVKKAATTVLDTCIESFGVTVGATGNAYSFYMDNINFVVPGDFQMLSYSPEDGATGIAVTEPVTLTFNRPVPDADTTGITISADGTTVEGVTISEKNGVVTVTPPEDGFAYGTTHTVTMTAGLTDIWGKSLPAEQSFSFTTETAPVFELTVASPADGATDVALNKTVTLTFSNHLKDFDASQVTVKTGETPVEGVTVTEQDGVITITPPESGFAYSTTYTVRVPAVTDIYRQTLPAATISFTTEAAPPEFKLTAASPADGATGVTRTEPVTLTFSNALKNFDASQVTVKAGETPVEGVTVTEQDGVITIMPPAGGFAYGTTYTVSTGAALTDFYGQSLAAVTISFTTEAPPEFKLTAASPANGATDVDVTEPVTFTFSNALKDFNTSQVTVKAGGMPVEGVTVTEQDGVITIAPPAGGFAYETAYTVSIPAATDIYGQSLAAVTISFTTEEPPEFRLTAASPADGAVDVAVTEAITFTFSNALKDFNTSQVTVKAGGMPVEGVTVTEQDGVITIAPPESGFAYETAYTVSIPAVTDIYGQTLVAMQRSFTTMKQLIPYNRALVDENFDDSTEISTDIFDIATFKKGMSYAAVDAAAEDLPEAATHGNVVKIAKTATGSANDTDSYFRIYYSEKKVIAAQASKEELKHIQLSFDVYFPEKMAMRVRALDNISGSSTKGENLIWFRANGTADFLDGSKMNYEAKTWYHINIYLDFAAETPNYTVYCNGKRVANKVTTKTLDTCLVSFGVVTDGTTGAFTYYYDNVRFAIPAAMELKESSPADGAKNVDVNTQQATLTFNSPLKDFDASKVTVKAGSTPVENVTVTEQGGVITVTFPQKLDYETTYTISVAAGVEDVYGQALKEAVNVSFQTAQRPAAFRLTESSPVNGAGNVDVGQEITLTFSNPIANFDAAKVSVQAGGAAVENVTVTTQDNVITIMPPDTGFAFGTVHTVSVDASLTDIYGQTLAEAATISFTTANRPAAFVLTESAPVNGAENVALAEPVTLTFSNAIANFDASKVEVRANGTPVENAVAAAERNVITITPPQGGFDYETTYAVSVAADLTDVYGQTLAEAAAISFTTVQRPAAFALLSSSPADGAEDVNTRNTVTLMFSNPIADFAADTVTVSTGGTPVANVTVSETDGVIRITPPAGGFAYKTVYTVGVSAALTDIYGQSLAAPVQISFTTADEPEEIRLDYNRALVDEAFDNITNIPATVFASKNVDGLKTTLANAETEQLKDAAEHGNVVKIAKDTTNVDYFFRIDYTTNQVIESQAGMEELKKIQTSFDIYLPEKMNMKVRFYDNISGTATKANNLIVFGSDGKMSFLDGSWIEYKAGEWYRFHVYLDFNKMNYTVYCNDKPVAKDISLRVLDTCIVSFGVTMDTMTSPYTCYLDNMRFAVPDSLRLVESSPANGAKNVNVLEPVTLTFNNPFGSFDASKIAVRAGGELIRNIIVNEQDGVITLDFPEGLRYDTSYTISVGAGLTDIYGQHLMTEQRISFTTMKKQFTVMQPVFQNSEGMQITQWEDGMKAVATVKNPEETAKTAALVTVVYDKNGSMVKQFTREQTIPAGQTAALETVIDVAYQAGYTVRAFLCEDGESLKLLSGSYAALSEATQQPDETAGTVNVALDIPKLEQNKVELTGSVSQKCVKTVLLKVKAEDGTLILVTPVQTDAQGKFIYHFTLPDSDKAMYTVEADGTDIGNRAEKSIGYLSDTQKAAITTDINAATSAGGVETVVQQWKAYLNLDEAVYENSVYQMVYEQISYTSYDAFRDMAALAAELRRQINKAEWSELTKLLNTYGNIILNGVDGTSRYTAYGAGDQNAISKIIVKSSPFLGIAQFREVFTRTVNAYQPGNSGGTGGTSRPSGGGTGGGRPSSNGSGDYHATSDNNTNYIPNLPVPTTDFVDLEGVPWAKESILTLRSMNIISADSTYRPMDSVTREEFVKLLAELLDLPLEETVCGFTDAESGAWYNPYLAAAQKAGIINGNPDGSFGIGNQISRQDMAVMAYRAVTATGRTLVEKQQAESFNDMDSISGYAVEAVSKMQQAGVISGVGGNLFAPDNSANRAEAAVIICRLLETVGKEDVQ